MNKKLKPDEIYALLTQYNISKEKIVFSDFEIFLVENSYLISSLEKIIYIPYLYFKIRPPNKEIERVCIEIITRGEKDLSAFIKKSLQYESEFYVLDKGFWHNWSESVQWCETAEQGRTSKENQSQNKQHPQQARLKLDLTNILDNQLKLKQGLIYKKDFVIVTKK